MLINKLVCDGRQIKLSFKTFLYKMHHVLEDKSYSFEITL